MSYRHRGGPKDGESAGEIIEGYSPVIARENESGAHPMFTQDVIWASASITKARFDLEGAKYEAEVGSGIRTLVDNKGRKSSSVSRQKVLGISAGGFIFVEPGMAWGTPDGTQLSTVEVSNLEVLEIAE